ncbi:MAG: hypothetical protein WAM97_07335 [Acidimicrobiales bacterium]
MKGGRLAFGSVILLTALTAGAAALSIATSPNVADYGLLPRDDPVAAASLDSAVNATMDLKSFTIEGMSKSWDRGPDSGTPGQFQVVFQAPATTMISVGGMHMVGILANRYWSDRFWEQGDGWYESGAGFTFRIDKGASPLIVDLVATPSPGAFYEATTWLSLLFNAQSVQRSGNTYHAETIVVEASRITLEAANQL